MKKLPLATRFWPRVNKNGPIPATQPELGNCWIWLGGKMPNRYGSVWHNGAQKGAHRAAWELQVGPIPEGLNVLHRCDVKPCVRREHLFLGTFADNSQDMAKKGRGGPQNFPWLWAGEASANHKLTAAQVAEIRAIQKVRRQPSDEKIAARFGVTRITVSRIRLGKSWAYA